MNAWSLKSRFYHKARKLPFIRNILAAELRNLKALAEMIPGSTNKVLDIGTGTGSSLLLYEPASSVFAVDSSCEMIKRASRDGAFYPVAADSLFLPFKAGSFHFAAAVGLAEYINDTEKFFSEVFRIVSPGGFFLATFSPAGLPAVLRRFWGSRINTCSLNAWKKTAEQAGFSLTETRKSFMQVQTLFEKPG